MQPLGLKNKNQRGRCFPRKKDKSFWQTVQTARGSENKENDGEDVPRRYNLRRRKPVDRYQAPMEIRQRDRERTNSGQPCSVRQKESLENAGSQKCRRRARQRHADDISDSTPSCSSPLLSTCDTEESGESSEDSESTSPRRLLSLENRGGMNLLQMNI
eukprot:XP_027303027.1 ATPase family AAA domain-containing protein 2-like isoform X1 [Anas platyrhynchos]